MSAKTLDLRGLKCPHPTLQMTLELNGLRKGDVLEAVADCPSFESDLKSWCARMKTTLLWLREEAAEAKRCQVMI